MPEPDLKDYDLIPTCDKTPLAKGTRVYYGDKDGGFGTTVGLISPTSGLAWDIAYVQFDNGRTHGFDRAGNGLMIAVLKSSSVKAVTGDARAKQIKERRSQFYSDLLR